MCTFSDRHKLGKACYARLTCNVYCKDQPIHLCRIYINKVVSKYFIHFSKPTAGLTPKFGDMLLLKSYWEKNLDPCIDHQDTYKTMWLERSFF